MSVNDAPTAGGLRLPVVSAWRRLWPPRLPTSLSGRLALSALAITAVWVLSLTAAFDVALSSRLRANADDVLRSRASAVLTTLSVSDGRLTIADRADDSAIDTGVWILQGTRVIERPPRQDELDTTVRAFARTGQSFRTTPEPHADRLFALPVMEGPTQVGTVVAVLDLDPYRGTQDLVQVASAVLGALLLLAVWLTTRASLRRALAPVDVMAGQAADWSAGDLDRRFGAADRPRELELLAERLDGVLDRLSAVLRREQQLTAELSHELRTPLTRIVAEAELGTRAGRTTEQTRAALVSIGEGADAMSGILETLLVTARSEAGVGGRSDCREVLTALVTRTTTPDGVRVEVEAPAGCWAGVAPEVLERTVSPLLENALRYARTRVLLAVRPGTTEHLLTVQDDGPGVDPLVRDEALLPGRRVEDGHGGAGLGLALARRLARSSGGDLRVGPGPGGAVFELTLPRA